MGAVGRRRFLTCAGALVAIPLADAALPAGRVYRIGYLAAGHSRSGGPADLRMALVEGLRERGYIQGNNLDILWRGAEGQRERLPGLAKELVEADLDVIVSTSDPTHHALQSATKSVPVVMLISQDPVARGLVASLARPGGNITGLSTLLIDLEQKQLELLREALPAASKLAFLRDDTGDLPVEMIREALGRQAAAARALGFALHSFSVRMPGDLSPAFAAMSSRQIDALRVAFSPFTLKNREAIAGLALRYRLPMIGSSRLFTQAGGLMSYGADLRAVWRRGAYYVDRILKGAKPADLPVEQPPRFDLVVNLKTAKAIGVTLPESILLRAIKQVVRRRQTGRLAGV